MLREAIKKDPLRHYVAISHFREEVKVLTFQITDPHPSSNDQDEQGLDIESPSYTTVQDTIK